MPRFQIKTFEPEAVVFDTASGDTHYLTPLALALFHLIQNQPGMTAADIETSLAARLSLQTGPHFTQMTDEAISSLRRIGLLAAP
ncbi:MAG: HPr-rel-A system PqqD family peptide chaperone [Thiobacillus sp.]